MDNSVPRKRGKPRAEAAGHMFQFRFRLSPRERERLNIAARINHQTFSAFARDAIATAAEECLEIEPIPREGDGKS